MTLPDQSTAFITGAASGLGRAIVLELVTEGCSNLLLADISAPGLEQTKTLALELNSGVKINCFVGDLSQEAAIQQAVDETVKAFGRIDYAANCAGIAGMLCVTGESTAEEYDRVTGINIRGVWLSQRAILRQMKAQEPRTLKNGTITRGNIVNISSILGLVGVSAMSPYVVSKHGVVGLTKADAIDYAPHAIRINAICPGYVKTAILTPEVWSNVEPGVISRDTTPMCRMGLPEEIAGTVVFLMSDKASYITGTSLAVDGGYTCH